MKRTSFWILAICMILVAGLSSAATLNCSGITDVASNGAGGLGPSSGNNCNVPGALGILFSNFTVSPSAGFTAATIGIAPGSTGVTGSNVNLDFQIGGVLGTPLSGDILLQYMVTGGISGIDLSFQASPGGGGGNIVITEIVCTVAFVNNVCPGTTLANLVLVSTGNAVSGSQSFNPAGLSSPVFIKKDIAFANASMSEFVNSHDGIAAVPEPMTFGLMGAGLLGLGLLRRRFRS